MLLAVTRFLGMEQLSQLTFYDYVVGITLGDIAGFAAVSNENKFLESMYILTLFAACAFGISLLTQNSRKARLLIEGEPTVLIYNGQILEQNMDKARYNMDNLITQLRGKGYFEVTEVQFAILETNGELSVIPSTVPPGLRSISRLFAITSVLFLRSSRKGRVSLPS
jgi:uncharacterized membrane protein YcaP (DUF421 family)